MHVTKHPGCFNHCVSRISHKGGSKIKSSSQHGEEIIEPIDRQSLVFGGVNSGMKGVDAVGDPEIGIIRLA